MNINKRLSLAMLVSLLTFTSLPVLAITEQQKKMLDQLDQLDHQEFSAQSEKAYVCIHARDFDCAEKKIAKASKYVTNPRDRTALRIAKQDLAAERRFQEEEQAAAAERARQIQLAEARAAQAAEERRRSEQRAQEKADNDQLLKGAFAIAAGTYVGHATRNLGADQQSRMMTATVDAVYNGNIEGLDAAAKQVTAEREQAHNAKMQAIREQRARDERAAQAQKEREEREERATRARKAREERAEAQRVDSERAAKRGAAKKVALASGAKRASAEHAQADAAAKAREKQQADELKAQQEREKQRLAAERRSQELRDIAERKRVAAAEEAKQKAEKAQAEKQVEHGPGSGGSKDPKTRGYRNPGEDARYCVTVQSTPNSVTLTNNCGVDIFALTCGDLKYTKKRCGDGPKGGFFTQSNNIKPGENVSTDIEGNGSIRWASCKGSISFGNDGEYVDYPNGSYTCLKR